MRPTNLLHAAVLVALSLSLDRETRGDTKNATTLDSGGCVRHLGGRECRPLPTGANLPTMTFYRASERGGRIVLADGSHVRLSGGSVVQLLPPTRLELGSGNVRGQVVRLVKGVCDVTVSEAADAPSPVLVRGSRQMSALVKSGSTTVRAGAGTLSVANLRGEALATSGDDWLQVPAGNGRSLRAGGGKGTLRPLMEAPTPGGGRRFALAIDGAQADPLELSWGRVHGAKGYEVLVERLDRASVSHFALGRDVTSIALPSLGAGAFRANVRAIGDDDLPSQWASPVALTCLGVALPSGAYVTPSGSIQLPERHALKFLDVDGLEVGVGESFLSPPPKELSLLNGEDQVVRIRHKGGNDVHTLTMQSRNAEALVDISPKNPRWPGPALEVRVRLAAKRAGHVSTNVRPVPRALLDLAPVDVAWVEKDGFLVGTIPSQAIDRPHVLRVVVDDQRGVELGRGSVEIASAL